MTTIEQAAARLVAARQEYENAASDLRRVITADKAEVNKIAREALRKRRSWAEADAMTALVREYRKKYPLASQREIGLKLGLTRDLVCYYLSPRAKETTR